ncbi:MAG: serine/threonine-protein kinase, partial [Polyangiaceae bacterium]
MARSDAHPLTSSPLAPGYRLDRYELLGPLAEGGMASVWIARQRGKHGFEKLVALKTILPQYASDLRFQQMFLDEARIASRIEHFNVARILDLGEEHDVLYLAMEYVDGDSLSKLRRAWQKANVPPPTGVILRILADTCSGLHEAHEMRGDDGKPLEIVHRDVSPHNILVSVKGVAKVIDFGIAKARDRLAGETNAGVLKGKIQYMAPEQALGRRVDRRADLWAIGATLYHLLTGKPPYEADNTLGTLHLLTSGRPPLPLPPTVHPAIAGVVRRALTTPADKRYRDAAEMRDAIEAAMIQAQVSATPVDVAAFMNEHLSARTVKRRQVIDIALATA